jgi:hypothetical protein
MPDPSEIPSEFERLLREVRHGEPITNKYCDFDQFLSQALDISLGDIYTTHVAKVGRFDVRMTQSTRARESKLRVALIPRELNNESDWAHLKSTATRFARDRNPGITILLICDGPDGWAPRWGIEPKMAERVSAASRNLRCIGAWFPKFELSTYPYVPSRNSLTVQEERLLQAISVNPGVSERLYQLEPAFFARLIEEDVSANDVVAIAHRKAVVERFRNLLNDSAFFTATADSFNGKKEAVWQNLLEENPWILGVSLAGQLLTSWNGERLEQVVTGFSISGPGKRADALMRTNGRIRAMVFAEIKHHETHLLGTQYRSGAWAPSAELVGAVAQAQQTVHLASRQMYGRLADVDNSGIETGEHAYMVRPRSFVILGNLDQLRNSRGIHRDKYESFELYRRNLYEPDIMTFDELLARAEWHVEAKD